MMDPSFLSGVKQNPLHLSKTAEWGSPPEVVELARAVLGTIDLDPASSHYWNERIVRARQFYDGSPGHDGLIDPWFLVDGGNTVFLNPPGDKSGQLVKRFWRKLVTSIADGTVDSAFWVGFSLEQLVQLQSEPFHPLSPGTFLAFPSRRIHYLKPVAGDPQPEDQPTHGSYLCLVPSEDPVRAEEQRTLWLTSTLRLGWTVR